MSYPSINSHLEAMGTTVAQATETQMKAAFIQAFQTDLPLGFAKVQELVDKLKEAQANGQERVILSLDPTSVEGQQYARLLGPDIPRMVLEEYHGVAFGFYNCCAGVAGGDKKKLGLSLREQIAAQHPTFVDC